MKTILETGGARFIGSCCAWLSVEEPGTRFVNLDKLTYAGNLNSLEAVWDKPQHVFVQHGICRSGNLPLVEYD